MTFLEKFRAEHPNIPEERVIKYTCPSDFGIEGTEEQLCLRGEPSGTEFEACFACWNREVPEEKTDCHANAAALARNDGSEGYA